MRENLRLKLKNLVFLTVISIVGLAQQGGGCDTQGDQYNNSRSGLVNGSPVCYGTGPGCIETYGCGRSCTTTVGVTGTTYCGPLHDSPNP